MARNYLDPMIRAAVSVPQDRLPLMADIANRLASEENGEAWHAHLAACLRGGLLVVNVEPASPVPAKFIARDHFKIGTGGRVEAKIYSLGDNFQNWFLDAAEEITTPVKLQFITLESGMFDKKDVIADKLGGVAMAITSLQDLYAKLEQQPRGPQSPDGDLLTNGQVNIFYIPQAVKMLTGNCFRYLNRAGQLIIEEVGDSQYLFEINGQWYVLRAVGVGWDGDGWYVNASPVGAPNRWRAGDRVFSRKAGVERSVA